jgi:hypothetical protein
MTKSELLAMIKQRAKDKMPELKLIDLDKGQFGSQGQNYPLSFPALLFEYGNFKYSNTGDLCQLGEGTITFNLYLNMFADTFKEANKEEQATAHILTQERRLWQAFQGFEGLVREQTSAIRYGKDYAIISLIFTIVFWEYFDDGYEETQINQINITD